MGVDEIISPVINSDGEFFVSGKYTDLPKDGDANGSYHIAKRLLMKIRDMKTPGCKIDMSNKAWFKYVQENPLLHNEENCLQKKSS